VDHAIDVAGANSLAHSQFDRVVSLPSAGESIEVPRLGRVLLNRLAVNGSTFLLPAPQSKPEPEEVKRHRQVVVDRMQGPPSRGGGFFLGRVNNVSEQAIFEVSKQTLIGGVGIFIPTLPANERYNIDISVSSQSDVSRSVQAKYTEFGTNGTEAPVLILFPEPFLVQPSMKYVLRLNIPNASQDHFQCSAIKRVVAQDDIQFDFEAVNVFGGPAVVAPHIPQLVILLEETVKFESSGLTKVLSPPRLPACFYVPDFSEAMIESALWAWRQLLAHKLDGQQNLSSVFKEIFILLGSSLRGLFHRCESGTILNQPKQFIEDPIVDRIVRFRDLVLDVLQRSQALGLDAEMIAAVEDEFAASLHVFYPSNRLLCLST
jgi:hypothetical protein